MTPVLAAEQPPRTQSAPHGRCRGVGMTFPSAERKSNRPTPFAAGRQAGKLGRRDDGTPSRRDWRLPAGTAVAEAEVDPVALQTAFEFRREA